MQGLSISCKVGFLYAGKGILSILAPIILKLQIISGLFDTIIRSRLFVAKGTIPKIKLTIERDSLAIIQ